MYILPRYRGIRILTVKVGLSMIFSFFSPHYKKSWTMLVELSKKVGGFTSFVVQKY